MTIFESVALSKELHLQNTFNSERVMILNAKCAIEFQIRSAVRLVRDLIICQCLVVDA